jgi:hypothetical protein
VPAVSVSEITTEPAMTSDEFATLTMWLLLVARTETTARMTAPEPEAAGSVTVLPAAVSSRMIRPSWAATVAVSALPAATSRAETSAARLISRPVASMFVPAVSTEMPPGKFVVPTKRTLLQ